MKRMLLAAALVGALSLAGCGNAPGDKTTEVTATKLHFDATVAEVDEGAILVEPLEGTSERQSADRIRIATDGISAQDSLETLAQLKPGDTIRIGYLDGIAETYPASIDSAFEIALADGAPADLPPMVFVDGTLYYDTGWESTIDGRCGVMDGEITAAVSQNEVPTQEGQSNFGTGYGYQRTGEGQIEVFINDKWMVFEEKEVGGRR